MRYSDRPKRTLDISIAGVTLLVLVPLFIVIAIAIKAESRGPVFFLQHRVGRDKIRFMFFKFRTMTNRRRINTKVSDDFDSSEVTAVGGVLRRFKLDELPQLLNVLRGDMSIVGPRPFVPDRLVDMPDWAARRFKVRPGLTGAAQVNGNIYLSWPDRFRHDLYYVDNLSALYDLTLILKTLLVLLMGEKRFAPP